MVFSMIFWGASWVNVKVLSSYINEYELVFLRMGISFLTMIPIILYMKLSFKIDLKTFILIILASIILVLYSLVFFLGVEHGNAGFGGALVTTLIPINTFIILAFLNRKTISLKHSFALILGGFGVMTMLNVFSFDIKEIFSKDNIYFLLASLLWPILTIVSAKAVKTHALVFTFYVYVLSTIFLYIYFIDESLFQEVLNFDFLFWLNMFIISILSTTFATSIYFVGISRLGTKEVSSFIFLVPSSALILSAIFLGEKIDFNTIVGTVCTITAIYILNNLNIFRLFKKLN